MARLRARCILAEQIPRKRKIRKAQPFEHVTLEHVTQANQ